ncbi:MAG: hypothetical protein QOH71_1730 [Blastocatellia bacterium]|jgi:hypothetical protein|nr:hypothetical protein [Blastocatellia bacterium]
MQELHTSSNTTPIAARTEKITLKDEVLDRIAHKANVAQFVSFGPELNQRYSRIHDTEPNKIFDCVSDALGALLRMSPDQTINIRSFAFADSKSRQFIYGLSSVGEAESALRNLAAQGLYTIANETVNVADGGVSGVLFSNVIEFAPKDTPRCVEKPGTACFDREIGLELLETVYGFRPSLDYSPSTRVEFSLHPLRRGFRHDHTIVWELEDVGDVTTKSTTSWPNLFSRFIGDKVFGLLAADAYGLPVPFTRVFSRELPPFEFGTPTGTGETWIRTCPAEPRPGKFTTQFGWTDPYKIMCEEDPDGTSIPSVLAQEAVEPRYSGALIPNKDNLPIVEGVEGRGDRFMQGASAPAVLPKNVLCSVTKLYERAHAAFGPIRCEWVYDDARTWLVQMHVGHTASHDRVIYPGEAQVWRKFYVEQGLDGLRSLIGSLRDDEGVAIVGEVGITSHFGDLLRKAQIPSRIDSRVIGKSSS